MSAEATEQPGLPREVPDSAGSTRSAAGDLAQPVASKAADMMAVAIARLVRDGERAFFGVNSPLPMVGVLLAKRLHAPRATVINIAGGINPAPPRLAPQTTDARLAEGSASIFDNADLYDLVGRGGIDLAFLGLAQVDAAGRVNTSFVGPPERPKVRFPGGGGAAYILPLARRVILWRAAHTPRIFVERVDFVTAAGNLDRVVTPLCVFHVRAGRLAVESVHPYTTLDEVKARTGFAIDQAEAPVTPPPTPAELAALAAVDPDGVRRSEFGG